MIIESSEIKEQKQFKENEKRAKRLINKLKDYINQIIQALFQYNGIKLTTLTKLEMELGEILKKAFDTEKNPTYQDALKTLTDFIKQRIINIFCFGTSNQTYKDIIRLIALFCKQLGIL